jgi:hypothetical protein
LTVQSDTEGCQKEKVPHPYPVHLLALKVQEYIHQSWLVERELYGCCHHCINICGFLITAKNSIKVKTPAQFKVTVFINLKVILLFLIKINFDLIETRTYFYLRTKILLRLMVLF